MKFNRGRLTRLSKSYLEVVCRFRGVIQLNGVYKNTTETTRKNDVVIEHTRLDRRGFVQWVPGVTASTGKAVIYLNGKDTTTRKEDKSYGDRSLVISRDFQIHSPFKLNIRGMKAAEDVSDVETHFPQIQSVFVEEYLRLRDEFRLVVEYHRKAKEKKSDYELKLGLREKRAVGDGTSIRVEKPYKSYDLSYGVEVPRANWKAYPCTEEGFEALESLIANLDGQIKSLAAKARIFTGHHYLKILEPVEQFRAIDLGLIETNNISNDRILAGDEIEATYKTFEEANEIVVSGRGYWMPYENRFKEMVQKIVIGERPGEVEKVETVIA